MLSCLAIFLCFLALPITWGKQTATKIALDSYLTAGEESPWLSPSGDFAFGFQKTPGPSGGFLVAIWYNKIPERTVTWSANRDNLAQNGSQLAFVQGGLVFFDSNGNEINRLAAGRGAAYANLLDTGNFVMKDSKDNTVWQSFDSPTDTILPTQIMGRGSQLLSRLSETNYSTGRFMLVMQQTDGNLVIYAVNWPKQSNRSLTPYYMTDTASVGLYMVFNHSGQIYVVNNDTLAIPMVEVLPKLDEPTQYLYQRAILEFDGVFRRYVYPIPGFRNERVQWIMHDFVPQDICKVMNDLQKGGYCGVNSYCQIGGDTKPECVCPPGYSYSDQTDHMEGCKRDLFWQNCFDEAREIDQFEIRPLNSSSFGGPDYKTFGGISEGDCQRFCLSDCQCVAAVFDGSQCFQKELPLTDGRLGYGVVNKTFIKVKVRSNNWNPVILCWP